MEDTALHASTERLRERARALDHGDGVTISMDDTGPHAYYFTNQIERTPSGIEVEISSVQHDNNELLHALLRHTRASK